MLKVRFDFHQAARIFQVIDLSEIEHFGEYLFLGLHMAEYQLLPHFQKRHHITLPIRNLHLLLLVLSFLLILTRMPIRQLFLRLDIGGEMFDIIALVDGTLGKAGSPPSLDEDYFIEDLLLC